VLLTWWKVHLALSELLFHVMVAVLLQLRNKTIREVTGGREPAAFWIAAPEICRIFRVRGQDARRDVGAGRRGFERRSRTSECERPIREDRDDWEAMQRAIQIPPCTEIFSIFVYPVAMQCHYAVQSWRHECPKADEPRNTYASPEQTSLLSVFSIGGIRGILHIMSNLV
jgi:hypothetical protein